MRDLKQFSTALIGFIIDQSSLVLSILVMCFGMLINVTMLFARVLAPVIMLRFPLPEKAAIGIGALVGLFVGLGIETAALQFALRNRNVMSYCASGASGLLSVLGMLNSLSPDFAFTSLGAISQLGVFLVIGFLPPALLVSFSHLIYEELSGYNSAQHNKTVIEILRETNYTQLIDFVLKTTPDNAAQRAVNAPPSQPSSASQGKPRSSRTPYQPTFNIEV